MILSNVFSNDELIATEWMIAVKLSKTEDKINW